MMQKYKAPKPEEKHGVALREMRFDDYTKLNKICNQVNQEMIRVPGFEPPTGIVAVSGKDVVGGLVYKAEAGEDAVLDSIIVAKDWQGKGVGAQLMGAFLKRMAELDVQEIRTRPRNRDAAKYFESHGFAHDESGKGLPKMVRYLRE